MQIRDASDGYVPTPEDAPFHRMGKEAGIRALVKTFYDTMEQTEPALTRTHALDRDGHIPDAFRNRFGMFLIGWLGGPQEYIERYGHPRLRARHSAVRVDEAMRDAWLRCMKAALDAHGVTGGVRTYLDQRFAEVADFLRNVPPEAPQK